MSIFRIVNYKDDDVRRYAWNVISHTLSIFMAVLFFQGNREFIDKIAFGVGEKMKVGIHLMHCGVYLVGLLATIAYCAGVWEGPEFGKELDKEKWVISDSMLATFGDPVDENKVRVVMREQAMQKMSTQTKDLENVASPSPTASDSGKPAPKAKNSVYTDKYGQEVSVAYKKTVFEERSQWMHCWATLLAHCAGFAAIFAGGAMQQSTFFSGHPALTLFPVGIMVVLLMCAFQGSNAMRAKLKEQAAGTGREGKRAMLVHEFCDEAEKDVLALTISFLTVQSIRYALTTQLPNEEGLEEPVKYTVTMTHAYLLWLCGLVCMGLAVGLPFLRKTEKASARQAAHGHEHGHGHHHEESNLEKLGTSVMNALAMMFAWCLLWGARCAWMAQASPGFLGLNVLSISARILLALAFSTVAVFVTIYLDKIADGMKANTKDPSESKKSEEIVDKIVSSIALMVGFSWEHSFDGAVTDVANLNEAHKRMTKFALGLIVVVFLVGPWQQFILPKALQLQELKKARDASQLAKHLEEQHAAQSPPQTPTTEPSAPLLAS